MFLIQITAIHQNKFINKLEIRYKLYYNTLNKSEKL